ncbi:UDP-2,4-diacetamido-2,4,6-trideoxy-beta-L-altropyranose hydrolase [Aliidiomarina sedimenti]|uniref:UDP-2,4-diacetamido-2,4, 6-trideoxy-beta-L-altropyranose hydrolase n=1 Tax=Aliidiomarina sedimenti TaxID=1933879 RepID=A0ABY0BZ16_9GAMM|nr:UDP-2,4-diacetamido-2,4,6-trideoxy-beta-L-altropyranose hydrolase [Aliidiomarina sedimenti]RUO30006.1 UDP-2,4-diacetamido-2,4,6-trideoxy-beta-L-altropyranose hydrolase [Aliidiomarina sedimenti]
MKVVFRADASHQIGSGHVMRCLTLADALTQAGGDCQFICRNHKGHLAEFIRAKGYPCHLLHEDSEHAEMGVPSTQHSTTQHADWLKVTWQLDAVQTGCVLDTVKPDWLVVDHYALDHGWEQALTPYYRKLMVIDDLADRPHHHADVLLDQTLGRKEDEYRSLVSPDTRLLVGADYALLRPEFAKWRAYSLKRREVPELKTILINLGGVDNDNVTGDLLDALTACKLPADCSIVVVMGASAPHLQAVRDKAALMDLDTRVLSGVSNMAELMAHADFAIGAAGSTSWERCCLGLPAVMVVLAQNQQLIANQLSQIGACEVMSADTLNDELPHVLHDLSETTLKSMSEHARAVCTGDGATHVARTLVSLGA